MYHVHPFRDETPLEFQINSLGSGAAFDEVSVVAHDVETELRMSKVEDFDDPWWHMSVKEFKAFRTPLDHYDDGRSITSDMNKLNKIAEEKSYKDRQKDAALDKLRKKKEEELALAAQWGKPVRKPKSAWAPETRENKYVSGHKKVFAKYNDVQMKQRVASAFKLYIETAVKEKKKQLLEPEPAYQVDKYSLIKEKLGGEEGVIALANGWDKLAQDARKLAAEDSGGGTLSNLFSLDFVEACELGNVAKVVAMLTMGKGDPNATLGDDSIFIFLFNKVNACARLVLLLHQYIHFFFLNLSLISITFLLFISLSFPDTSNRSVVFSQRSRTGGAGRC